MILKPYFILISIIVFLSIGFISMPSLLNNLKDVFETYTEILPLYILIIIYALLLAIPFFPAFELGFCIMCLFGVKGIISIYIATVITLFSCFILGRTIFRKDGYKLEDLFKKKQSKSFNYIYKKLKSKESTTLFLILNMPCNSLIGGGSGVSYFYGGHSKMSSRRYLMTIIFSTLPLPALLITGFLSTQYIKELI